MFVLFGRTDVQSWNYSNEKQQCHPVLMSTQLLENGFKENQFTATVNNKNNTQIIETKNV